MSFAAALLLAGASALVVPPGDPTPMMDLRLVGTLEPLVLDYELPGHPSSTGRSHLGAVLRAALVLRPTPILDVWAGLLARVPFSFHPELEAGALPVVAVAVRPFGEGLELRLGSLAPRHGFHPGLVDEDRATYGLPVEESYNRSLRPEAKKVVGQDPFLPAEHGAQLRAWTEHLRAEAVLDWQLLETPIHREKFAFGVLGAFETSWVDGGAQLRVVHYGGERYTKSDPIRAAGMDAVRQPLTAVVHLTARAPALGPVRLELPLALLGGRLSPAPGAPETWHGGLEAGAVIHLWEMLRVGYRAWLPRDGVARAVSEDGDPVYAEATAHRFTIGLGGAYGPVRLDGRLDLVAAANAPRAQYLAVTRLEWAFDATVWRSGEE